MSAARESPAKPWGRVSHERRCGRGREVRRKRRFRRTKSLGQSFALPCRSHSRGRPSPKRRQLYRAILAFRPDHADPLHGLGVLAHQLGRDDLAAQLIEAALAQRAEPTFHNNPRLVLLALDRPHEAFAAVTRALELRVAYPEARNALGNIQQKLGLRREAVNSRIAGRGPARRLCRRLGQSRARPCWKSAIRTPREEACEQGVGAQSVLRRGA